VGGRPWLTNGDRWFFVQIGPALDIIGVGSRAHRNGGHKSGRNAKIRAAVFPSPLAGHSHAAVEWGQLNLKWPPSANVGGCASPQPDIKPLKTFRFRGLFAASNLAGNFARGSAVEAAGGKSQRKIGEGGRGAMTHAMTQL